MCGIVGLFHREKACDASTVDAMRDVLSHRGPDDAGTFLDGPLGLGHRRLSIIDLGGGHQPMTTTDSRFTIVYNGEIYNYQELRTELERDGVVFRTHSDTEVILELHARRGDGAVARLNGIFAYAIWDRLERRLLLARDRAGIKPLYLAATPRGLAFASEIKGLLHSGVIAARLNEERVAEYLLFRQVAGPESLFAGVRSLPPGHTVEIRGGAAAEPRAYWSPLDQPPPFEGDYADAVDTLDGALNGAVARQLMADVPLGTFCSGGIDSSLTTAIAARHMSQRINTFSVGFHEADFDESVFARLAATNANSLHHEIRLTEHEYAELLPHLVWHHDLPLNFANSVHIFAVSKLAREHVTVVLTGEGADELFGGYPRYYVPRLLGYLDSLPGFLRPVLSTALAKAGDHRLRKLAAFAARPRDDVFLLNSTGTEPGAVLRVLGAAGPIPLEYRLQCLADTRRRRLDEVSALAELDFRTYLVSILNRQDKMSMAASLEARVPFLDNELIDFARSLPSSFKQTLRHRKRVLKDVALRYLPAEIVHRRKSGFGVPLKSWFAGNGPMATMLDAAVASKELRELTNEGALAQLVREHRAAVADHSELLWGLLNLQIWRTTYRC